MKRFEINGKAIIEDGRRGYYSGRYEINYSSILTQLIQEAGRYCERFASDLFIDWSSVVDWIDSAENGMEETFLFGFRQNGVDHKEYVLSRYENEKDRARYNYRSLWRLDVETSRNEYGTDEIKMVLGRVF